MNKEISGAKALFILGAVIGGLPVIWYWLASAINFLFQCDVYGGTIDYSGSSGSCIIFGSSLAGFLHTAESMFILIFVTVPIGLILWIAAAIGFVRRR